MEQINDYVSKRRQNIKYKKSEEKYKKKKFFVPEGGYTPRTTIPKEFEFETEIRQRSFGKNKNRSCQNFHINQNRIKKNKAAEKKVLEKMKGFLGFIRKKLIIKIVDIIMRIILLKKLILIVKWILSKR